MIRMVSLTIRPVEPDDRNRLLQILIAADQWMDDEVAAAMAQVDWALRNGNDGEYRVYVAERTSGAEKIVEGYACYGPTPKTDRVFDLYWIAVEPSARKKGVGSALLHRVEEELEARKARMLLIETSSKESFRSAVEFYRASGYQEISRIKDFYRLQHDKIIFSRKFD